MKKSLYLLAVLFITLNAQVALADTIDIFNVNAVGGTLTFGTLTIDVTKGTVVAADVFDLTHVLVSDPTSTGWELWVADEVLVGGILINDRTFIFDFTTTNPGSLVGFNGGTFTNGLLIDFFEGVVVADDIQGTITFQSTVVPEPSTLALVLTGLGLLAGKMRRLGI